MSSCDNSIKDYNKELLDSISEDSLEYYKERNSDKLKYANLLDNKLSELSIQKEEAFSESLKQLIKISDIIKDSGDDIYKYYIYNNCIYHHYSIIESFPPIHNGAKLWKYSDQMKDWINNSKSGGKPKAKSKKNKISQKKQSEYKEILGKKMKIYKMPDSRKEYVKYKGELHHIADYKNLMKQKAIAKTKTKAKTNK
jgi:hypothetical protein